MNKNTSIKEDKGENLAKNFHNIYCSPGILNTKQINNIVSTFLKVAKKVSSNPVNKLYKYKDEINGSSFQVNHVITQTMIDKNPDKFKKKTNKPGTPLAFIMFTSPVVYRLALGKDPDQGLDGLLYKNNVLKLNKEEIGYEQPEIQKPKKPTLDSVKKSSVKTSSVKKSKWADEDSDSDDEDNIKRKYEIEMKKYNKAYEEYEKQFDEYINIEVDASDGTYEEYLECVPLFSIPEDYTDEQYEIVKKQAKFELKKEGKEENIEDIEIQDFTYLGIKRGFVKNISSDLYPNILISKFPTKNNEFIDEELLHSIFDIYNTDKEVYFVDPKNKKAGTFTFPKIYFTKNKKDETIATIEYRSREAYFTDGLFASQMNMRKTFSNGKEYSTDLFFNFKVFNEKDEHKRMDVKNVPIQIEEKNDLIIRDNFRNRTETTFWPRGPKIIEEEVKTNWPRSPVPQKNESSIKNVWTKSPKSEKKSWRKTLPPKPNLSDSSEEEEIDAKVYDVEVKEFFPIENLIVPFSSKQKLVNYLEIMRSKTPPEKDDGFKTVVNKKKKKIHKNTVNKTQVLKTKNRFVLADSDSD